MSDPGATQGAREAHGSTRRVRRLRSACTRCQRRKIRCDAGSPTCASCAKAHAECIYDDPPRLRRRAPLSRSPSATGENPELTDRIRQLEAIVRHEAPHVDLTTDLVVPSPRGGVNTLSSNARQSLSSTEHVAGPMKASTPSHGRYSQSNGQMIESPLAAADAVTTSSTGTLSHEVGLVSLSVGVDPKYIGPSSGYFFTQLLTAASRNHRTRSSGIGSTGKASHIRRDRELSMRVFAESKQNLPATKSLAKQLSETFFHTVHIQYPFLHQPTHNRLIDQVYDCAIESSDDIAYFQVAMVLSISALIMSRRSRVELPANGWCAAALSRFNSIQVENSVEGLQSLLLLMIHAMHSPSSKFNAWYINYQCLAMVLDLGLQRDPGTVGSLTTYQREMRTRIFWVVYSLDRKLCTMMGRPIGVRDEACDLRLPEFDDLALDTADMPNSRSTRTTHMSYAIHFFKLAKINSRIKYIFHSVQQGTPSFAYPRMRNLIEIQDEITQDLDEWAASIPTNSGRDLEYAFTLCQIHYNTTKMLLLQPSPAIPNPRPECLRGCYECSVSAVRLFNTLYVRDMLIYNWNTCHALILHTFCLIYVIMALPGLAYEINLEDLMSDLRAASNILSATGEHWAGAKRSRDLLEEIGSRAVQLVNEKKMANDLSMAQMATSGTGFDPAIHSMSTPTGVAITQDPTESTLLTQEQLDSFYSSFFDVNSTLRDNLDFVSHEFDISQLFTEAFDFPTVSSGY